MSNRGMDAPLAVQMDRLKKSMNSRDKRRDQDRQQRLVQSLLRPRLFPGQGMRLTNPLPTPLPTAYCALCWPEAHSGSGEHSSRGPVCADHTCPAVRWRRQLGPWRRCSSSCGKRCRTGGATADSVRSVPGGRSFRQDVQCLHHANKVLAPAVLACRQTSGTRPCCGSTRKAQLTRRRSHGTKRRRSGRPGWRTPQPQQMPWSVSASTSIDMTLQCVALTDCLS